MYHARASKNGETMRVLDPGHRFVLSHLDGDAETVLVFVKREGAKFPGNVGHYEGTTLQEVLRACISRAEYVNAQVPCAETRSAIEHMRKAVHDIESRAARRHGRDVKMTVEDAVSGPMCPTCGHVGCRETCR